MSKKASRHVVETADGHWAVTAPNPQQAIEPLTASVWQEGEWLVAQAIEIALASQGQTVEGALANLREALELHFEP